MGRGVFRGLKRKWSLGPPRPLLCRGGAPQGAAHGEPRRATPPRGCLPRDRCPFPLLLASFSRARPSPLDVSPVPNPDSLGSPKPALPSNSPYLSLPSPQPQPLPGTPRSSVPPTSWPLASTPVAGIFSFCFDGHGDECGHVAVGVRSVTPSSGHWKGREVRPAPDGDVTLAKGHCVSSHQARKMKKPAQKASGRGGGTEQIHLPPYLPPGVPTV